MTDTTVEQVTAAVRRLTVNNLYIAGRLRGTRLPGGIKTLLATIEQLQQRIGQLETSNRHWQDRIDALVVENDALKAEIAELNNEPITGLWHD